MRLLTSTAALLIGITGCVTTDDPAAGGFFNGVSGATSGTYDNRIEAREEQVAAARERNKALDTEQRTLSAQISASETELTKLKFQILRQKTELGKLDARTSARVETLLNADPSGATKESRMLALRKTIADAAALSADLARMSG